MYKFWIARRTKRRSREIKKNVKRQYYSYLKKKNKKEEEVKGKKLGWEVK